MFYEEESRDIKMTVTAKLLKAKQGNAGKQRLVEFTDGDEVGTKKYRYYKGSPAAFVSLIRAQVAIREDVKGHDFSSHVDKLIDLTPIEPEPQPDPTAAEIAELTN